MPIYEFQCVNCGKVNEVLVTSLEEDIQETCEDCGGKLRRIFSVTATASSSGSAEGSFPACSTAG